MISGPELVGLIVACKTVTRAASGIGVFLREFKTAPKSALELSTILDQKKKVLETLLDDIGTMSLFNKDIHLIRQIVD